VSDSRKYISAVETSIPNAVGNLPKLCTATDRASYALVTIFLKRRGLLDDTLVLGRRIGRTLQQGRPFPKTYYGRDHHLVALRFGWRVAGAKPEIAHGVHRRLLL